MSLCALAAFSYLLTYGNGVFDVRGKVAAAAADADARFCAKREDGEGGGRGGFACGIANESEYRVTLKVPGKYVAILYIHIYILNTLSEVGCPKNQPNNATYLLMSAFAHF